LDIPPQYNPRFYPFVILALVSFLLLFLTIRQFLRPIVYIEKRIIALEGGDLDSELPISGHDELAVLSANFNTMVKEIKNLLKQKERLLSDVSHELRTPLAKIRLMLALMPEHKKVTDVDKQIKVLDSLITNILLSDQMASPYSNLNIKKTTISKLIEQAVELTFVESVYVDYTIEKIDPEVSVDAVKMSIAIKNLIENAYKYSGSDEKIKIYINQDSKHVTVLVKDRGPGLEIALLENITKAFVRGSNQTVPGFGLGLSICYKVMKAHLGKLDIKNNPRGGASFTLCIPIK
jgi:two-component system OmpR family sensor kinase